MQCEAAVEERRLETIEDERSDRPDRSARQRRGLASARTSNRKPIRVNCEYGKDEKLEESNALICSALRQAVLAEIRAKHDISRN